MKLAWIAIVAALGCGKKDTSATAAAPAEQAKTAEPPAAKPAEPFKGPLTVDLVMAGKIVSPLEPWDAGFAKLQAKLGAPTKVAGNKYEWAAMRGDDCAYFYVTKEDGKQYGASGEVVAEVATPDLADAKAPPGNRAQCLEVLGKDAASLAEDPNAPGPPADGKVAIKDLVENAAKAHTKWDGKQVELAGMIAQMSTSTSGTTSTTSLYLYDQADKDKKQQVRCTLDAPASAKLDSKKPVKVKGTVKVEKMMSGAGDTSWDVGLEPCTVEK
jgi:hypothetical protein